MHYCQLCETAAPMVPRGDLATCPAGHPSEPALRQPLFVVTGASGAGKTTIYPLLAAELEECVVFDVDWLIDSFGAASMPEPLDWRAFRDAWLSVAHGVAQGGRATVLLSPFTPEQLQDLPARPWIREFHFALLDCADDTRRRRLESRPSWRERELDKQLAFARYLRAEVSAVIQTDENPQAAASAVAEWVRGHLGR